MTYSLYFLIVLLATCLGALSGIGGGVLMKPLMDFYGAHPLDQISLFSSFGVWFMSLVAVWIQSKNLPRFQPKLALKISAGALVGGYLGNQLFLMLLVFFRADTWLGLIQMTLTCLLLSWTLWQSRKEQYGNLASPLVPPFLIGLVLGALAAFLGIGGGAINVGIFLLCLPVTMKEAAAYSLATIFFSQGAKLVTSLLIHPMPGLDWPVLAVIAPAGILGGWLGSVLIKGRSNHEVQVLYRTVLILVILLNLYNAYQLWLN